MDTGKSPRTTSILAVLTGVFLAGSVNADTVPVRSDDFESLAGEASDSISNAGNEPLSSWTEVSARYKPVYFGGLPDAETSHVRADQPGNPGTGKGVRVRSSNGAMCLDAPMLLTTLGATAVTIAFDKLENTVDYYLQLQYSALGDFSDAVILDTFDGNTPANVGVWQPKSYTLVNGSGGITFTDTAQFMIRKVAGTGVAGGNDTHHVFDNIVITAEVPDTTPPTLIAADIVAEEGTGPVGVNTLVTYKVFFSEDMDASTVDASDFGNAGTSTITIGTITEDFPGEFAVPVTPTGLGTLRLQVNAAAVLKDMAGNDLDTDPAIPADITLPVGLISNGGFENPGPLNDDEFTENAASWLQGKYDVSAPAVWIVGGVPAGYAGVWNPGIAEYIGGAVPEGQNMGFVQTLPGFDIGVNQVLSTRLQANTQYNLSVKVGNPTTWNEGLAPDYRIELLAGGVLLQSASGPSPLDGSIFITASLTHNSGSTPAQLGQALEIRLLAVNDGSDTYEVDLDDVQLTVIASGPPYVVWTGGPFSGALGDPNAALDFDNGGLDTGIEWVVGGDPTDGSDDAGKAPDFDNTTDADFFIFTYNRTDAANTDPNTSISVQYGSNLTGWIPAVHDGLNIIITPTDNGVTDSVQVKIKRTLAPSGSLFARLNVVVAP